MGSIGPKEVSEQLRKTQVLSVLNLARIYFGAEGLELFEEGIRGNSLLSALNLGNNAIGNKPIEKLTKTIMRSLDLSFNKISNDNYKFKSLILSGQ